MTAQIGKDIYFDLVDHDKVPSFRIQKQMPFTQFKVITWGKTMFAVMLLLAYSSCRNRIRLLLITGCIHKPKPMIQGLEWPYLVT